ncbi:MAG: hypothetical protein COU90_03700 [Candidatus Ryanbacteria bacterium CG10_big_fil_rev_8_21_14_0_10_43_42]|uniref:Type IV pilus modification protein PilV n=1 Tax=Candidatus Ryanbacteria bacterium CG10_big_fil_rev_8_21_14_0_10_43_42 TaxID=1974864 RepID=A0A2M8KW74_9BACT|nr:MAG: hypothetical protein COU90_03700 [Candidatus Ryanbacteria bacterium CG10_big_fil_rev_8_21_14_0_10_43_42]
MNNTSSRSRGFGLIEIVIAITIVGFLIFGLITVARISFAGVSANTERLQAIFLLEETMEAVRIMRDNGWTTNIASLTLDTPYYLEFTSGTWGTTGTPALIDSTFTRTITLSSVERDANDDIIDSGGTIDTDTKRIIASVSWPSRGEIVTVSISGYITNIFAN